MSFAHFWVLSFIPLCILAAFLQLWWRQRIIKQQASIGTTAKHLCKQVNTFSMHLRFFGSWIAILLIVFAVAGPRWGSGEVKRNATGAYVVFALDCSRSMLAEDLYPNRMQHAHFKALDIMKENPEHRVALLPFARIATLRTPFTGDHVAIAEMIKDCDPDLFPAKFGYQGTAIGESVQESCRLLQEHLGSSLAIVVLSDGSDSNSDSIDAAIEAANKHGVRIYGLFFGDEDREVSLTIDGKKQIMKADKGTLDKLALETGGISVNATNDNSDILALSQHIRTHVSQEEWEERQRVIALERYQLFLIPAILLLSLSLLLPSRRTIHYA